MLDRLNYEVIKEVLFDSERFPLGADMRRCWGGEVQVVDGCEEVYRGGRWWRIQQII